MAERGENNSLAWPKAKNSAWNARLRGFRLFAERFSNNKGALVGLIFVLFAGVIALAADVVAPHDPFMLGAMPFQPPGVEHWFGTDDLGRDVFSGIIFGARTSLIVGFTAAAIGVVIGVSIGAIAGYSGGKLDEFLMRLTEMFLVLPRFFLAIIIVAFFGSGIDRVIFVIGILSWPTIARMVRAQFLWLKEQEFVGAARSLGMSGWKIVMSEILPNAIPPAIVVGSLEVARAILLEAGLSFLGLGDANVFSWGTMLRDAQSFLQRAWWMAVGPGVAISLVVLAINLFGDGLNDALNPRSQER